MDMVKQKVNAVGKNVTEVDWAYLSGLMDADGAIMAPIERHSEKKFGFRIRVIVKVTQSGDSLLNYLKERFGVGQVRKNRSTFDWLIRDQDSVKQILCGLQPFIKVKLKQTKFALALLEKEALTKEQLIEKAQLADALSLLNVRSKNRRLNFTATVQATFSPND